MVALLEWIGVRARWVLAIGAIAALFLQDLAAALRPALPAFVALMYLLAMVRIDLGAVFHRSLQPRRLAMILATCIALMVVTPTVIWLIAHATGLPEHFTEPLIYIGAGPPLGSAAALCLLLGLDAALALELTIIGSFLAPILGPFVTAMLLGDAVPIEPWALSLRLAAMIGAGAVLAVFARKMLGSERIARRASVFDGLGAIAMLITVVPIFDGATEQILSRPFIAIFVLVLVFAFNIGLQLTTTPPLRKFCGRESGGAIGLTWGNRNAALYLAALPPTPIFTLFVALYQFPMYMTPLLMGRFYRPTAQKYS